MFEGHGYRSYIKNPSSKSMNSCYNREKTVRKKSKNKEENVKENHSEKGFHSIAVCRRCYVCVYMSFYQMDFSVLCMFGTWKYFYDYLAN